MAKAGARSRRSAGDGAHGTIWYMGVKTRLLDRLEQTIAPLLTDAARRHGRAPVLLDLFTGTGVVAERLSPYARVVAADVQQYACTLARARLQPAAGVEAALARTLARAHEPRAALRARYAPLLDAESRWLARPRTEATLRGYRAWILEETAAHAPEAEARARDADGFPPCLVTAYYRNVYFGIRQAIELDALRWAIEQQRGQGVRALLLAALLFAASRSTSATAHFAQPRALGRLREVAALMRRREIAIETLFVRRTHALLAAQRHSAARGAFSHRHRVVRRSAASLMARLGEAPLDVVYADPPYTADNYSRFYHALETLVRYDYPPLQRRGEALTKGRYPARRHRHRSAFCRRSAVAEAFRSVCRFAAARGAALVWSYAHPSGLLIREVFDGRLEPFLALLGEYYDEVAPQRIPVRHSGAGSRNRNTEELIITLLRPREAFANTELRAAPCAALR